MQSSFQDISKSSFFFSGASSIQGQGNYRSGGYLIGKFFFHFILSNFYSLSAICLCVAAFPFVR
jgi:hypothetical protein